MGLYGVGALHAGTQYGNGRSIDELAAQDWHEACTQVLRMGASWDISRVFSETEWQHRS